MKTSTAVKGACGEFYVASYLSALGLIVALPRGGVPSSDLLVTTPDGGKTISLQIKTATSPYNPSKKHGNYYAWSCSEKSLSVKSPTHWYAFVDLKGWTNGGENPEIYFVPSGTVAVELQKEKEEYPSTRLFFCIDEDQIQNFKMKQGSDLLLESLR